MDHTAIKQIQDTATASIAAQQIGKFDTAEPVVALPENFKLQSLDSFMPNKTRYSGKFDTSRPASFVSYHTAQEVDADVFVDPKKMAATAIYDAGTIDEPGHCKHRATLTLEKTAEFSAYMKMVDKTVPQRELAEWIEDWREVITAVDEDDAEIPIKALIATVRSITVEALAKRNTEEGNFSSQRTTMQNVEAKSSVGKLPKAMFFTCIPYKGLPSQKFVFRISIKPAPDKTMFSTYRVQGELEDETTAENFCILISDQLGGESKIYHGTFVP